MITEMLALVPPIIKKEPQREKLDTILISSCRRKKPHAEDGFPIYEETNSKTRKKFLRQLREI